jgi:predicted RNA-binding Zn-ribbon protein involved in translation (DUF1610 family)
MFEKQNPEEYEKTINKKYGFICPECGNVERFQIYFHACHNIIQDEFGEIIYKSNSDIKPEIIEVQCANCGNTADICRKGIRYNMELVL